MNQQYGRIKAVSVQTSATGPYGLLKIIFNMSKKKNPGIEFEEIVASLQQQLALGAEVSHNERIIDRIGQARQFDVVIRGMFAGHKMLGVIECKDLKRKVNNLEVDAFVTKAQDINANFKVLMSKSGFTEPAIVKCKHYGIQPLSLLNTGQAQKIFIGNRWTADVRRWNSVSAELELVEPQSEPLQFNPFELKIMGKRVLDWYTNYLIDHDGDFKEFGWTAGIKVEFSVPQLVHAGQNNEYLCSGIVFSAQLVLDKLQYVTGTEGTGFINWDTKEATFTPGSTITTGAPIDFTLWSPRDDQKWTPSGFIEMHMEVTSLVLKRVEDAIDWDTL